MKFRIYLLFLLLTLAAACGQGETPLPPPPTQGPALETGGNAVATTNPQPALTLPPPPTVNLAPTATIGPPPTATTVPTAAPERIVLGSPDDFGDTINPLTGETVDDPAVLDRRPLAIKISNAPPMYTRPQSGLNSADLVFEHITEAGITRFTMIVYGKEPPDVGPIRSARLIDLELPAMYDAALVYSGSSDGVRRKLLSSDFASRVLLGSDGYYRTGEDKPFEHTLYAKPATIWAGLEAKGLNTRPVFLSYLSFDSQSPPGGTPAVDVTINYKWTVLDWRYDPENGRYWRWADGEVHRDRNTDEQVNAANVIVILATHVEDPNICEQVINGVCTALSVEAQIWGSGPAVIFRDGQRYDVTWQRANRYDMLTFADGAGKPFPLQVGNSWFQVIPTYYDDPVRVNK